MESAGKGEVLQQPGSGGSGRGTGKDRDQDMKGGRGGKNPGFSEQHARGGMSSYGGERQPHGGQNRSSGRGGYVMYTCFLSVGVRLARLAFMFLKPPSVAFHAKDAVSSQLLFSVSFLGQAT
jgi:hypothetical protein